MGVDVKLCTKQPIHIGPRLFQLELIDGTKYLILIKKNWENIFDTNFSITQDTQLQWFQYRVLHRILPLNKYLVKIKQRDCNLCSLCGMEEEDILHVFCDCSIVIPFWVNLKQCLWESCNICINIDNQSILFGTKTRNANTCNIIYLLSKYYIYISLKKGKDIKLQNCKAFIRQKFEIQKCIARESKTEIEKFERDWIPIFPLFG